jgi:GNAT superfamily N-acetyltransferase
MKATPMKVSFAKAARSDAETLVQMRIEAMRESLQRIGRFDPQRARDRFMSSFDPTWCRFIVAGDVYVGFVQTKPCDDYLLLEHLYVVPAYQGSGIGSAVLESILADADSRSRSVKVGALRDSQANRFYQRHGFLKIDETDWDIYYLRAPLRLGENR